MKYKVWHDNGPVTFSIAVEARSEEEAIEKAIESSGWTCDFDDRYKEEDNFMVEEE